ncbi:hypothetical protein TNCV_3768001 [Trichonephila clavipes]|nr:hypothetical protein TNCV_3768001 [Trichonephila clavipes]
MYPWSTAVLVTSTYCQNWFGLAAGGVFPAIRCANVDHTFLIGGRLGDMQDKEANQSDGGATVNSNTALNNDTGFWTSVALKNEHNSSAPSHHSVSKLQSYHRDVAVSSGIIQENHCRSTPLSMSVIHRAIRGATVHGFQLRINEVIDVLQTVPSAANGV